MNPVPLIYRALLASGNMAVGWLFYASLESLFGLALVVVGVLIVSAVIGGFLNDYRPVQRKPA